MASLWRILAIAWLGGVASPVLMDEASSVDISPPASVAAPAASDPQPAWSDPGGGTPDGDPGAGRPDADRA